MNSKVNTYKVIVILLFIFVIQIFLRIPFLEVSLTRDEGIYGYMAQTLLSGRLIYKDAFDSKPPLLYFIYASIFKTFGQSILSIRIYTLLYSIITTFFIFLLGWVLFNLEGGLLAGLLFAIFSGGPLVGGACANTENFMILFLIIAFLCFILGNRKQEKIYFFLSGIFSGLAFFVKPTGIINFLPLLIFTFYIENKKIKVRLERLTQLLMGFFTVLFAMFLYLLQKGIFFDFLDSVFLFNLKYLSLSSHFSDRLNNISYLMNNENSVLWILAASGAWYIWQKNRSNEKLLLLTWSLFSLISVGLFGYFFGAYFILLIPPFILLSVAALREWEKNWTSNISDYIALFSLLILSIFIILFQYPYYLKYSTFELSYNLYYHNVFNNALSAAQDIKKDCGENDYVYNWGGEGEINYYTNTRSPSKYFFVLSSFKPEFIEKVEKKAIEDIKAKMPKYIIFSSKKWPFYELRHFTLGNYNFYKQYDKELYVYKRKQKALTLYPSP